MKEHPVDRRIIRTKKALRGALTSLMRDKAFDEITVSDITQRAEMNRGTFYLHYKDKYDLLRQNEEEILSGIQQLKRTRKLERADLRDFDFMNEPLPLFTALFEFFQEHAEFLAVVLGPRGNPAFQARLKEVMREKLRYNILSELNEEDLNVPLGYLSAYAISAQLGVIQHWLDTGMKESPEQLSIIVSRLVLGNPISLYETSKYTANKIEEKN